jgi:hypothetical protein
MKLLNYITEDSFKSNESSQQKTEFFHEISTAIYISDPNFTIKTGRDLLKAEDGNLIKTYSADGSISSLKELSAGSSKYRKYLFSNVDIDRELLRDAKRIAIKVRDMFGKPSGPILWTGTLSKLGASDIIVPTGGVHRRISLKKGYGQIKNLKFDTIGETLFKNVIKKRNFSEQVLSDNIELWDGMTIAWLKFIYDNFYNEDLKKILKKYLYIRTWKLYQKTKLNKEELEVVKKYDKSGSKFGERNSLRFLCRKMYTEIKNKEWLDIRAKYFNEIFKKYFLNKEYLLRENIEKLFMKLVSSYEKDLWHICDGGEVVIYIPNESKMKEIIKGLKFKYNANSDNTGYKITLKLNDADNIENLMQINTNIRWKQGQMVDLPDSSSVLFNFDMKKWQEVFKEG